MEAAMSLLATHAPAASVLIRFLTGWVFLSEGIQKFLFAEAVGSGRFARIGIPWPELTGPFVGAVEIAGGALLLIGLLTRVASFVLLMNISVAIVSTKIPILLGRDLWIFAVRDLDRYGFWSMAHESRTDFSMFICLLFVLIVGAGPWSADKKLSGG
jgi:putative oxidoreductase